MKRLFLYVVTIGGLGLAGFISVAAQSAPMTEEHIARIRSNCVEAQTTLRQVHASDAGLRVNLGPLYESLSNKLMTPFNSRVALAKEDATGLTALTSNYENQLNDFRATYKDYEESMSALLRMNCTAQPVTFYDNLASTREKRKKVYDTTQALKTTIQNYRAAFVTVRQKFQEKAQ